MFIFICLYSNFIHKQQLTRKLAHQQTTSSTQLYAIIVGLFSLGMVTNTWAHDPQPTVAEVVSMGAFTVAMYPSATGSLSYSKAINTV